MSDANALNPADLLKGLGDDAKYELLEHLAGELGFDLTESVEPQSDIIDVVAEAITSLQNELGILKSQFSEGAELDYSELSRAAEVIESVVAELSEAHANLNAVMDSEFEVDDEEDGGQ